jgi:hypothetical protein
MAQRFQKVPDNIAIAADIIGNNSEVFAPADPVSIDANGNLIVATAGVKVIGFATDDVTMSSSNETVAKVKPNYIPAYQGVKMVYTADQAAVTADDIGEYCDLTGTTGAIQMDLTGGTSGQFIILEADPDGDGTTTLVVVETAEPQSLAFAQV